MPGPGGSQTYVSGPQITSTNSATAEVMAFSENTIPVSGSRVRDVIFGLSGTSAIVSSISRFTLKAGQVPFVDATPTYIRSWLGWYGKKAEWDASLSRFTFPLHGFRGWSAPPNQGLRIENTTTTVWTGTKGITLHEGLNDTDESQGFMYFLATTFNVPASSARYTIPITQPGVLSGIVIPTPANLTLLRLYDSSGLVADFSDYLALQDSEYLYMGTTVVSPIYWKLPIERLVVSGVTRLEVGTGAGWSDAEFGFHTYIPTAPAK